MENFEMQYMGALSDLLKQDNPEVSVQHNRTGVDTLVKQHMFLQANDVQDNFPMLRGKKMYPYMALKELLWMLQGRTDVKWLNDRGVSYWDEWVREDGTIGKSYGYQFRNFSGIDQIKLITDRIVNDTMSRRIILSLWNPNDLKDMALEPCQYDFHFTCEPDIMLMNQYKVHLHAHMRSTDSFLGLPYDIIFDALFLSIICNFCTSWKENKEYKAFVPGNIYMTCDNFHLYTNHVDAAKQYTKNVIDNMYGVINSNTKLNMAQFCNQEQEYYTDFDSFLKDLIEIVDTKNRDLLSIDSEQPDVYGPIKAEIAI